MKMPKIPGWAYSRAKNICLENRPIPPLKMTHICMFKMRFITFRTVFKQELFFFGVGTEGMTGALPIHNIEDMTEALTMHINEVMTRALSMHINEGMIGPLSMYNSQDMTGAFPIHNIKEITMQGHFQCITVKVW